MHVYNSDHAFFKQYKYVMHWNISLISMIPSLQVTSMRQLVLNHPDDESTFRKEQYEPKRGTSTRYSRPIIRH